MINMKTLDPMTRWKNRVGEDRFNEYNAHFQIFLKNNDVKDPAELLTLSLLDANDLAEAFYGWNREQGFGSCKSSNAYTAVRSFFSHNGMRLGKTQRKFQPHPDYTSDYTIDQKQFYDLINIIQKDRDKGAAGCMFQGGQRDGLVCALKVKFIETKNWESARVVVFAIPEIVLNANGKNVNKYQVKYRFGILDDIAVYIRRHLDERRAAGEVITGESWLFRSRRIPTEDTYYNGMLGRMSRKPIRITYSDPRVYPITKQSINNLIVKAAEKLGFQQYIETKLGKKRAQVHAHSGRPYQKTQTRKAGLDADLREFLLGHKVKMNNAYDKFSNEEVTNNLEEARPFLALSPIPADNLTRRKQVLMDTLAMLKTRMAPDEFERFKVSIQKATTSVELDGVLRLNEVKVVTQ